MASPPPGSGLQGPLAIHEGTSGAPPACPTDYSVGVYDGLGALTAGPTQCACSCGAPSTTCGPPVITFFSDSNCTTSCSPASQSLGTSCTTLNVSTCGGLHYTIEAGAPSGAAAPVIKIIDFGVSKAPPADGAKWLRETSQTDWLGSPAYMSPEQLRSSAAVDARTDIWSMGVTLFELLTGKLPFTADDLVQLITKILNERPLTLRAARPDAPAELDAILQRCLEKDPARRFWNIAELAQELAEFGPPRATERSEHIKNLILQAGV
ncbi:MAG: serine/threonine protein kinase, partial [Myxococcales bacterium]|nr:serine/threonine protein kinase [Myxococcales bacterium]